MLHIQDSIERTLVLPADPLTVWNRSFGSADALASWFPQRIEGDYSPDGTFHLIWGEHRSQAKIVEWEVGRALAFQWHPGDAHELDAFPESELTTVRFTLAPSPDGTQVTMIESGFSRIAQSRRDWALGQNTGGWDEELAKLLPTYAGSRSE
ncbi:MAG: SRPBCC domain-containing protein [Fimbriimonadaceae bacterium]|nr:SRPBCC domain-containing protein [Fimbriimonadaceae bacterium]